MINIKTTILAKVLKSKKEFFFFNTDKDSNLTSYVLTNDYSRFYKNYNYFRVISTIKKQNEFITI